MIEEELLNEIPLFSRLTPSQRHHLVDLMCKRSFQAGAVVLEESQEANSFFVLIDGELEVLKSVGTPEEQNFGVRDRGTILGEMSLFSSEHRRTATLRAVTDVLLLELQMTALDRLLQDTPALAYEMLHLLSNRLQNAENATIRELRGKNKRLSEAYEELKAAQAEKIEQEKLQHELEIARQIQLSFLPQELPRRPGLDFGARMVPARAVGGDFFDFIPLDEIRLGLVVGDVCDKGVPAALFMALSYSLIRAEAGRHSSPGETLRAVNAHLLSMNPSGMFVTLVFGILDCATGRFDYARAGHPQPLLLDSSGQSLAQPRKTGQSLGLLDEVMLDEQSLLMLPGSQLCIYSDGLTEAENEQKLALGEEGLCELVARSTAGSAQAACDELWQQVQAYSGTRGQQDDFTVVLIRR